MLRMDVILQSRWKCKLYVRVTIITFPLTSSDHVDYIMEKENITKYIHGLKCRIERILKRARKKRRKSRCPLKRVPTPYPMSRVTTNMSTSS